MSSLILFNEIDPLLSLLSSSINFADTNLSTSSGFVRKIVRIVGKFFSGCLKVSEFLLGIEKLNPWSRTHEVGTTIWILLSIYS
jgi:hypothetical protein